MGSETPPTAIEKLLAWQREDTSHYRRWKIESCAIGIICELEQFETVRNYQSRHLSPTLDAAIEAALVEFGEWEKGSNTCE